jgi:hypothetical protein
LLLTTGNVNYIIGARELLKDSPDADYPLADWFREKLRQRTWGETVQSSAMPPQNPVALRRSHDIDLYK